MRRRDAARRAREWAHFDRFAAACGCVPTGPFAQPNPPEPDIVVGPSAAPVGIELTELHPAEDGEAQRRREGEQAAVLAAAHAAYVRGGHPPVHVWVSWTRHPPLVDRAAVAARIASIVLAHPPNERDIREVGTGFEPLAPGLPVTRIGIARASVHDPADWRDGDMHEVGWCTAEAVRARLATEDAKIARYQRVYAERWLVLVVWGAGPSTWGDVDAEVGAAEFESAYDRVFVLEYGYGRAHPLRLARRAPPVEDGGTAS